MKRRAILIVSYISMLTQSTNTELLLQLHISFYSFLFAFCYSGLWLVGWLAGSTAVAFVLTSRHDRTFCVK